MMTTETFDFDLSGNYTPVALYFHDADLIEYVREDASCIYQRIDETLTLAIEMDSRLPIGFRIKGFKNHYLKNWNKSTPCEEHFVSLVPIIEKLVLDIASQINFASLKRAYNIARDIASADNVKIERECLAA